ncbi:MAG: hypothetical protein ABIF10_04795 [Candidatus Woesearchaeota archaeon]
MRQFKDKTVKYMIGFIVCILVRLIPFRPANVEPIMTTMMPFAKKWGWISGGLFAALSMVIFDLVHPTQGFNRIGIWTFATAGMYGLIGIAAGIILKANRKTTHYVGFAVIATLFYDFITGPVLSSVMFDMPFMLSLSGQIPFTLRHLAGNVFGAWLISPILHRWVVANPKLETSYLYDRMKSLAGS